MSITRGHSTAAPSARHSVDDGIKGLARAGCGDLALVGHAVDVGEIGPLHAEMLCRLVHALGERLLTAGDPLGDHDGNVVGRLDDEDLERDEAVMQEETDGRVPPRCAA
jgi:hypothetical protein